MRFISIVGLCMFFALSVSSVSAVQYIAPLNAANQSIGASNLLYLDNTNGRIGVGTAAPGYKFDVSGNGRFTSQLLLGDTTPTILQATRGATAGSQIILANTYAPTVGGRYSGADTFIASNAYQTADSTDAWGKASATYSSNIVLLGLSQTNTAFALQVKTSPANTVSGAYASFFPNTLFTVAEGGTVNVATGPLQLGGTNIVDTSRNLVNIGTIGSGAIASTGTVSGTTLTSTVTTGTAPLTVSSTTAVTNLNSDLLDGQHGTYYADIPSRLGYTPSQSATSVNSIYSADTRNTDYNASDRAAGLYVDFRANAANGLSDGGTYNGVITFRGYGSGADLSGGYPIQLAYTANGNVWSRIATGATTWGTWYKLVKADSATYAIAISGNAATATTANALANTDAAGQSAIAAINSATAGTLPVTRGGTGVTSSTGSGSVVLSASPTLSGTVTMTGTLVMSANATPVSNALISAVSAGSGPYSNGLEFGHPNTAGYRGTLGAQVSSGANFLALNSEGGTSANTYRTRGIAGVVYRSDLSGGVQWLTLSNNADNQAGTSIATLSSAGAFAAVGALSGTTLNTGQGAYELYAMDQNVLTTSAPTFATVNTGQGAYELYAMDQNVLTTSAPTFATVNTGQGAYELYAMDQNVRTTDAPTFATINTGNGAMEVNSIAAFTGNQNLGTGDSPTFGGLLIGDGSLAAPGLRFSSDTNTGIYRGSADNMSFVAGGTQRIMIENTTGNVVITVG